MKRIYYVNYMRPWEAAALIALCAALLAGLWAQRRQEALAANLVRLHVIAASDSAEDQRLKLRVRDAVLETVTPLLEGARSREEAAERLRGALPALSAAAEEISGRSACASLGTELYPTRVYDGFALPAGRYVSLRVTLGPGRGRNWWCVVYPPLCAAAAAGALETASLPEDDLKLITGDGEGYVFRFRVIEWWHTLTAGLQERAGDPA